MRYSHEVHACALTCAAAVLACSLLLARSRARKGQRFCPGPKPAPWKLALPCWFITPRCGYDLAGLRTDSAGALTCPECARKLPSIRRAPNHPGRIRWRRLSLVCITLAWAILNTPYIRSWRWVAHLPDSVVVAHRIIFGWHGLPPIRAEADDRLANRALSPRYVRWLVPALIRDLRNDTIRGNGATAMELLGQMGLPIVPDLEAALDSTDWQQRQLAASILRSISLQRPDAYTPSDRLLRVTAEGLRADRFPADEGDALRGHPSTYTYVYNAREGVDYLTQIGAPASPWLLAEMRGQDEQSRLLAAGIAGLAHLDGLLPIAAPILIPHLKDNRIGDDAKFASSALLSFGPDVLPYLQPSLDSTDPQERKTAQLIALDLVASDSESTLARRAVQIISTVIDDPARLAGPEGYEDRLPHVAPAQAAK